MLRLMMGALLMACCIVEGAHAVDIYQWKDSGDVIHFTDNSMNVPEKYRKVAKRKINKLRISAANQGVESESKALGKVAWFGKCASCHTTGGDKKDKRGLGMLTVNQQTKFPATIEDIVPQLRRAASGSIADMGRLDVTDDELKSIAKFILGDQ